MTIIKTQNELKNIRQGGKILADILHALIQKAVPGITTSFLDQEARKLASLHHVHPSFLGYQPKGMNSSYPAAICTCINDEIVHAIPSDRKLKEGDILSIDMGIWFEGFCLDSSITVGIGNISNKAKKIIQVTQQALYEGISVLKGGVKTGDIGYIIQKYIEKNGFQVVRDLAGHGVGHYVHEDPIIPNFGAKGTGVAIPAGTLLALEPMAAEKDWNIKIDSDGWGIRTADGGLSAHFEHTVLVTENGFEVLTEYKKI